MTLLFFGFLLQSHASMISPTAVLLNTCNHSSNSNILLSTMAVTDLLVGSLCVPLSAVTRLLVSYQILSDHYICVLDFVAIWVTARRFVRFCNSDNDSMGKVGARGHWKMD